MGNRKTAILSQIFPEAMESPLILHCVLMIAAKDLLKYDSSVELQASAVEYYGRAISGLREALSGEQSATSAFTHGAQLVLSEARQIFEFPGLLQHLESGSIMGTSQKVFFIVFRVALHLSQFESSMLPDKRIYADLVSAKQDLRNIRASFHVQPDMSAEMINDGVTFELYRLACLIYLQSLIDGSISISAASVQEMVSSFVTHLAMLPPESPSDGFLCWPMVIVGRCAIQQTHRAAISTKLKTIFDKFRSEIFSRNLTMLKQHWRNLERVDLHSMPGFTLADGMRNFNDAVLMV
ncbi:hypothetical protein APSETT444_002942 [Aspergillus pseudonomiae]